MGIKEEIEKMERTLHKQRQDPETQELLENVDCSDQGKAAEHLKDWTDSNMEEMDGPSRAEENFHYMAFGYNPEEDSGELQAEFSPQGQIIQSYNGPILHDNPDTGKSNY